MAVDTLGGDRFGFRETGALLESTAEFVQCSVYQLPTVLTERFDVVVFLGVLHHLRHPLLALDAIRRIANDAVYLETSVADYCDDPTQPTARFHRLDDLAGDASNWWSPTTRTLDEWCRSAGFDVEAMRPVPDEHADDVHRDTSASSPEGPSTSRFPASSGWTCPPPESCGAPAAPPPPRRRHRREPRAWARSPEPAPAAQAPPDGRGTENEAWFVESGRRSLDDLDRALAAVDRTLDTFTDVLEFGCGCGRMSRWLLERPGMNLTGIDIQPELIEWCAANLPGGRFETNPGLPPTRFADHSFDLVVNHSVFTHLDEDYQDLWLAELARITRPDGLLVLSFSGDLCFAEYEAATAAVDPRVAAERRALLEEHGILFLTDDDNDQYFPDFYHATFHTPSYVFEHWQHWFELLAHLPANNLEFQDAVVVRPRTTT